MPLRVLIVDDARLMRTIIKKMLEDNGFEVAGEANDGKEAVEKYRSLRPDVVCMDIEMPGMNGIEALREILQFDGQAKVVMVTSMQWEPFFAESMKAGAKGFISKPFQPSQLLDSLRRAYKGDKMESSR